MPDSWKPWIPFAVVCAAIFAMSSTSFSAPVTESLATAISFAVHVLVYSLLSFVAYRALERSGAGGIRGIAWAFAIALVYGVTDEIHQAFVPGRFASAWDLIPDAIGAIAGGWTSHRVGVNRTLSARR